MTALSYFLYIHPPAIRACSGLVEGLKVTTKLLYGLKYKFPEYKNKESHAQVFKYLIKDSKRLSYRESSSSSSINDALML